MGVAYSDQIQKKSMSELDGANNTNSLYNLYNDPRTYSLNDTIQEKK